MEQELSGGNLRFICEKADVPEKMQKAAEKLAEEGKTPLFFAKGERSVGMIAVADVIKEDSPQAVKELQNMGIHVVMLTGDNERTAKAIGKAGRRGRSDRGRTAGGKGKRDPQL